MYEQAILHKALERLEEITGFQTSLEPVLVHGDEGVLLLLSKHDKHHQFILETKHHLTPSAAAFYDKHNLPKTPLTLFVTSYVNVTLSKKLKKQKINFIDTVGNAYIDTESLFIFIVGNKPEKGMANNTRLPFPERNERLEESYSSISVLSELSDILDKAYNPISTFSKLSEALEESYQSTFASFTEQMNTASGEVYQSIAISASIQMNQTLDETYQPAAIFLSRQMYEALGEAYEPASSFSLSEQMNQALGETYKAVFSLYDLESTCNNTPTLSNLSKTLEGGSYKPITSISQRNKRKTETLARLTSSKLKLLFVLLSTDEMLNKTYRSLQKISGVSTGTITKVIKELEEKGYLTIKDKKRTIQNKASLIRQWVSAYNETLRPKLIMGYYKAVHKNWYEKIDLQPFNACWSGEIAADKLTHYLVPHFSSLYIDGQPNKLILLNGLKTSSEKEADVEILGKFWHIENKENPSLAPTLLIYADLINSSDPRNIEVAQQIYNDFID